MSFKLLVNCPFPEDGTSKYRGWGPLGRLRTNDIDLIMPGPKLSWVDMMNIDGIFMQRPFLPYQVELIHLAKRYGKKVWIDYDDNLFCVARDNPTHDMYNAPATQENVKKISSMADVITTSTNPLARVMGEFNKNVQVIPNAIDLKLFHRVSEDVERTPTVIWRGSHTHFQDMYKYTDEILDAYVKFPEYSWVFFGYNPTWITEYMAAERHRVIPFDSHYLNYMGNLQRMRGAIHIVPLIDTVFNQCKSNVSHMEASLAGSAVLGPDWEEWQGGHIERYKDKIDFGKNLRNMLSRPRAELAQLNNADWEWIAENRSLEKVNKLRIGVIAQLMGGV